MKREKVLISDLAFNIAHSEGISPAQASRIIKMFIFYVLVEVATGKQIRLESFCNIEGYYQPKRTGSHPKTHEPIEIGPSVRIKFSLSNIFKQMVQPYIDKFETIYKEEKETTNDGK